MLKGLVGKNIVIGGSRKIVEISTLIEKQGGTPLSRPLQGTVFLAENEVEPSLLSLVHEGTDWAYFHNWNWYSNTFGLIWETWCRRAILT